MIAIIRRTRPFTRNHAGPDRIDGRADLFIQSALRRNLRAGENLAAGASFRFLGLGKRQCKLSFGIKYRIGFSDLETTAVDHPDTPPGHVGRFENLLKEFPSGRITYIRHCPTIGVLQCRCPRFDLFDKHGDRLKQIGRLETGHHARDPVHFEKVPVTVQAR